MDVISHGLWGGVAFGRKNPKNFILAFLVGFAPDALSFGIFMLARIFGFSNSNFSGGHMDQSLVPQYIHILYNITHSLFVFGAVFLLVWLLLKKPLWLLGAWGLHILVDIPSHSFDFFPTPFLWPISNFKIDGIGWGNPIIFFPNLALLVLAYALFFYKKIKIKKHEKI